MKKKNGIISLLAAGILIIFLFSGCSPGQLLGPTVTPSPTRTPTPPPTSTPTQTGTPTLTLTAIPPTATYTPSPTFTPAPTNTPTFVQVQNLLLRPKCGSSYTVKANQYIQIFYGGWGVKGKDLANQWASVLQVKLTIDGQSIGGKLQAVGSYLPYNCTAQESDVYWLYYKVVIPGLAAGDHTAYVTYSSSAGLSDGTGVFGPGQFLENTFTLKAR